MKIDYHKWWSPALQQEMELLQYGHAGQPILIFPSQGGRFYEYQDFGMVEVCRPFIESGKIQLITVDSVDRQSWLNESISPADRARRHLDYERYILDEVAPLVPHTEGVITSGCSMGAYHAANFFFRHPQTFGGVIALSGVYTLQLFIGDAMNDDVYPHVPLAYLPNVADVDMLERYRHGRIVICVGQGDWEEPMLTETRELARILQEKQVAAWIDIWGHDVCHDWPWWRQQMPYFLGRLFE